MYNPHNPDFTQNISPQYWGSNIAYYENEYETYKRGYSLSFNWAAFFFGPWWFFYRKLYVAGILAILLGGLQFAFLGRIFIGLIANKHYFSQTEQYLMSGDTRYAGTHNVIFLAAIILGIFALIMLVSVLFVLALAAFNYSFS